MNPENPAGTTDVTELSRRAAEAKQQLQRIAATASSSDGTVTVTVNTSGALQELSFGPRADEMPRARLAAEVLKTARRAQAQAAQQITTVMAPLIGADSDAMKFLEEQIPVPEVPEEPAGVEPQQFAFSSEQDDTPPAPPRPPARPRRPAPGDDDDDFYGGSFLQKGN